MLKRFWLSKHGKSPHWWSTSFNPLCGWCGQSLWRLVVESPASLQCGIAEDGHNSLGCSDKLSKVVAFILVLPFATTTTPEWSWSWRCTVWLMLPWLLLLLLPFPCHSSSPTESRSHSPWWVFNVCLLQTPPCYDGTYNRMLWMDKFKSTSFRFFHVQLTEML